MIVVSLLKASMQKQIVRIVKEYLADAYNTYCRCPFLESQTFMDLPLLLSVQYDTLTKHSQSFISCIYFITRCTGVLEDVSDDTTVGAVGDVLTQDTQNVISLASVEDETQIAIKALQLVLTKVFFKQLSNRNDVIPLFISCPAVQKQYATSETFSGGPAAFSYAAAQEMTLLLAALKYIVRCVVVNNV